MDIGLNELRTAVTVAAFLTFLGIIAWAYSGRRRNHYEQAARMALEDDPAETAKEQAK
ncbi:MAG TPA: cbb3-type cytochrome c oxidase subunit 3 [Burkholderiales bacterium]|jgi:cytochrome c oxidase cbb3-type subunit 4|nr:cbb3-type cytochrome c oxidase subunit 3 [Burkholderiales bacterium]